MDDMPDVVWIDRNVISHKWIDLASAKTYLRCPADIDPDDAEVVSKSAVEKMRLGVLEKGNRITELEAERDATRKQTAELVAAIEESHAARNRYEAWQHTMSPSEMMLHPVHELQGKVKALAAKLKEQQDDTILDNKEDNNNG